MLKFDFSSLEAIAEHPIGGNLESFKGDLDKQFHKLLHEVEETLEVGLINKRVVINCIEGPLEGKEPHILDFGVNRGIVKGILYITISLEEKRFLSQILLREAYLCFVPEELKNNLLVKFFINPLH